MNPKRFALAALIILGTPAFAHAQDDDFHILVTNDDGIASPGIQMLAAALRDVGTVHVVAPCSQASGSSMAVNLGVEIAVREVDEDGVSGTCAETTPASTVMLALNALAPEGGFDLVVSGINAGANIGYASHMSGTVGAAMMGALHEIPAVAASLGGRGRDCKDRCSFTFGFVDLLLFGGFRFLDDALLLAFGFVDLGISFTFGSQDDGALFPFRAHLFFHRGQHVVRRIDVLDLVAQHLYAPWVRGLVEFCNDVCVDRATLLERAVEVNLADFRTQGRLRKLGDGEHVIADAV